MAWPVVPIVHMYLPHHLNNFRLCYRQKIRNRCALIIVQASHELVFYWVWQKTTDGQYFETSTRYYY